MFSGDVQFPGVMLSHIENRNKGPVKRGHIVADSLLPTHVSPFARAQHLRTNFVSGTQKMFLIVFRNILCPQQMFPSLRSPRNMGNNVSATLCPRLLGQICSVAPFRSAKYVISWLGKIGVRTENCDISGKRLFPCSVCKYGLNMCWIRLRILWDHAFNALRITVLI